MTASSVLVETFVEGDPITHYAEHPHPLNKQIARIGALTFFEMLFKYNFIHADCHGGNIIVKLQPMKFTFKDRLLGLLYKGFRFVENIAVKLSGESEIAKALYLESKREDDKCRELELRERMTVDITMIDAGMVLQLNEADRRNFVSFVRCIVEKEPEECAKMVYSMSLRQGNPIVTEVRRYEGYYDALEKYFKHLTGLNLKEIQGIELLRGMLELVRGYGMKLDGQLGALITNMLILEQIVKDLDPGMNIMTAAVPYFYAPQP